MNIRSIGEDAAPFFRAWAAVLLLAPMAVCAQGAAANAKDATGKGVTTVTVPATPGPGGGEPRADAAAASDVPLAEAQEEEDDYDVPPLRNGDATLNLLAWQRSGEIASRTPRPIAGSVANRSYERYLKSFEFPIPERLSSTVNETKGGGSR